MKKKFFAGLLTLAMLLSGTSAFAARGIIYPDIISAFTAVVEDFYEYRHAFYFIYDIDKDGIPELMMDNGLDEATRSASIFKYANGEIIRLGHVYTGHSTFCTVPNQNGVMLYGGHMDHLTASIISIEGNQLTQRVIADRMLYGEYDQPWEILSGSEFINSDDVTNIVTISHYLAQHPLPAQEANANPAASGASVVYSDISAYINHYPIPSYAYEGGTVVVAEDLRNYGFDVTYDNNSRTLSITPNRYATVLTGMGTVYKHGNKLGQHFADALYSDINVYFNGSWIPSCAINGYTMVKLEDLASAGAGTSFTWDGSTRSAKLWLDWAGITDYRALAEAPSDRIAYNGEWYYTPSGDNRPLISLEVSNANENTVDLYGARMHGKGVDYHIGTAQFIDSQTAVAYGTLEWEYNGTSIPKRYEFTFLSESIKMDIYDSDGNFEETCYFYR